MPCLSECTDLTLLEAGLVSLSSFDRDGPVLAGTECMILNEDIKLESRHDWTVPFLVTVDHDETEEVQQCHRCGRVRSPTFGPYLSAMQDITPARLGLLR